MKQFLLTISLALTCLLTFAQQSFEGKIIYQNTIKSKTPGVTDEQFTSMMGNKMIYFFKDSQYKTESNGQMVQWQLYVHTDNKLYSKLSASPAVLWNDAAVNPDEVLSSEMHKNAATILGYVCDELVLHCKSGEHKYYFSNKLPANSKLFTNHQSGNWYAYLSRANALPLKTIIDNKQFTVETVAIAVQPMKLDDALFALPAGIQTAPMPMGY